MRALGGVLVAVAVAVVAVTAYALAGGFDRPGPAAAPAPAVDAATADWHGNVSVAVADGELVVTTQDLPGQHGTFPNAFDPNAIEAQNDTFRLPLDPVAAGTTTTLPARGPIGVALNGVPFYGPYDADGQDAVASQVFDACNGHPDMFGRYHYHEYSPCIATATPGAHSPLLGFAFDGFPIYGPLGANGTAVPASSLDACHGHYDAAVGEYVYVATTTFPYVLGCYSGTPVLPPP